MRISKLTLTNVRAIEHAELTFRRGMNLLVGLNGLGKTTVLNALCNMIAPVLSHVNEMRIDGGKLGIEDIRNNAGALDITLDCEVPGYRITSTYHKPRERFVTRETGKVRGGSTDTPERRTIAAMMKNGSDDVHVDVKTQLAVFFSTKRTIPTEARTSTRKSGGEISAALADSLSSRELRLADIADWMKAQEVLGKEDSRRLRHLTALRKAARLFLPDCTNLRAETDPRPNLFVDKKIHGKICTLSVRQLSDGERNMLILALVITQKLSQTRPDLSDPSKEAEAVILIDELDLHLHPKWQRTIVSKLTKTFPRCQFIATTHSPQIVAAVEPEQVILLKVDEVITPDRTLGMDSNWILRHLMEADERPADADKKVHEVEKLIQRHCFRKARATIVTAKKNGYDLPEWSVFDARMARLEILGK